MAEICADEYFLCVGFSMIVAIDYMHIALKCGRWRWTRLRE